MHLTLVFGLLFQTSQATVVSSEEWLAHWSTWNIFLCQLQPLEWSKAITMIDCPHVSMCGFAQVCTCLFVNIVSIYTHKHTLCLAECVSVTISDNLCSRVCSSSLCWTCVCEFRSPGPGHNSDGWSVCVEAVIICYVSGCVWQPLWAVHLLCELRGQAGRTAVRIDLAAHSTVCRNKSCNS